MEKQDFNTFKMEIKAWLDSHHDDYEAFVIEINSKSFRGVGQLYILGTRIAPKLMKKTKRDIHGDIVPPESESSFMMLDDKESATLISEFSNLNETSVVQCFLAWLCFGKCFETMLERLRDILSEFKIFKWIFKFLTKRLVSHSITKHWRTKQDWEDYIIDECSEHNYVNGITKNAIQDVLSKLQREPIKELSELKPGMPDIPEQSEKPLELISGIQEKNNGQDATTSKKNFEDYLRCENDEDGKKKIELLKRIESKLPVKGHQGCTLSYLYASLIKNGNLPKDCNATDFYDLIVYFFPTYKICALRTVQDGINAFFTESVEFISKSPKDIQEYENFKESIKIP